VETSAFLKQFREFNSLEIIFFARKLDMGMNKKEINCM
jgi:hypothetical protein